MLRAIDPTVQTLIAELNQRLAWQDVTPASVSRRTIAGKPYLYALEQRGKTRVQKYLGAEGDPDVDRKATELRRAQEHGRQSRRLVQMIKAAGLPAPTTQVGRILESASRAGLFDTGMVLIGTAAYQLMPMLVGVHLDETTMMTNDVDLCVASLVDIKGDSDMSTILKRADPTFVGAPGDPMKNAAWPKIFRSQNGMVVEILTPVRTRDDDSAVDIPAIGAAASPLHFLEFLIADAMPAVALYGAGVRVRVPQPVRYAVHKLIVAAQPSRDPDKRRKDLRQAAQLRDVLDGTDGDYDDAINEARKMGSKWRKAIDASLAAIEAARARSTAPTQTTVPARSTPRPRARARTVHGRAR